MEIRAKSRRLKQRHDLKLIVIDYLQLMSSGKKVENRQQEVSEFSRQLKLLAKELDVPIVAISQLNRSPEQRSDKKPMLSDLRESGSIEQDADVVILLSTEMIYMTVKIDLVKLISLLPNIEMDRLELLPFRPNSTSPALWICLKVQRHRITRSSATKISALGGVLDLLKQFLR